MEEKLRKLYNTLTLIETKGENTKLMGVCLQFVEQLIVEEQNAEKAKAKEPKAKDSKTKGAKSE
jgi:hypothetical protein